MKKTILTLSFLFPSLTFSEEITPVIQHGEKETNAQGKEPDKVEVLKDFPQDPAKYLVKVSDAEIEIQLNELERMLTLYYPKGKWKQINKTVQRDDYYVSVDANYKTPENDEGVFNLTYWMAEKEEKIEKVPIKKSKQKRKNNSKPEKIIAVVKSDQNKLPKVISRKLLGHVAITYQGEVRLFDF